MIAVPRWGQQRSLARIFQVFSTATARSPLPRTRAWSRLTSFCRYDSGGRWWWRLNGVRMVPPAP